MPRTYQVRVRKPVEFIRAALEHFQPDSLLSFEGDLSHGDASAVAGASAEPTDVLRRNTTSPRQDFIILPVTPATHHMVTHGVIPQIGLKHRVLHVQIASTGRLVLGAYDSFHDESCWVDQSNARDTISSWKDSGIIGWYEPREWV